MIGRILLLLGAAIAGAAIARGLPEIGLVPRAMTQGQQGRWFTVVAAVTVSVSWILLAYRLFRLPAEHWVFGKETLRISSPGGQSYTRTIRLERIQHVGICRRQLEVAIADPDRHAPEFVTLPVRPLHAEDDLDRVEDLVETTIPTHPFSLRQIGRVRSRGTWPLDRILPSEPKMHRIVTRVNGPELHPVSIDGEDFEFRLHPKQHIVDSQGRCQLVRDEDSVFHHSGFAIGHIVTANHVAMLELTNDRVLAIDRRDQAVTLDGELLAEMVDDDSELRFETTDPQPRSILLLAAALWGWRS